MSDVQLPLGQHRHQRDYIYKQRRGEREAAFHLERMQHSCLIAANNKAVAKETYL